MKQLRPYQEEAIEAVDKALSKGKDTQMLVMATGTGKTVTACNIVAIHGRALWVTHTEELIEQSAGVLERELGHSVGIVKQERMEIDNEVVVASIQTLHRRLHKIPEDHFDVVVFDECHMAGAKTWTKTANHFTSRLRLGLTATPWRTDGTNLDYLFEEVPFEYPVLSGIKDGFLSDIRAIKLRTAMDLDKVRTTAGEFNLGDLTEVVDCPQRNEYIVDSYIEYATGRQAIAFCVDVQHAINLCSTFNEKGVSAEFVVGDKQLCPDRADRIKRYKNGETTVLVNVMVLTVGFDHPETACVIMACPTKSRVKFMQCVGRGTRLKENWEDCLVLDVVDVTRRHRLANSQTLDDEVDDEESIFGGQEKRDEAKARKEKARMLAAQHTDEEVDIKELPKVEKPGGWRRWWNDPASEKQLDRLRKTGYPVDDVDYTKGHAWELIANGPASERQIIALARRGYDVTRGVNYNQAVTVFQTEEEKKDGAKLTLPKKQSKNKDSITINGTKIDF